MGAIYRDIHTDHGVRFIGGAAVQALEGSGRVERVRLADGTGIECDCVVVGVGVAPGTRLAEQAGLAIDNGIVVDEMLMSSAPEVLPPAMSRMHATRSTADTSAWSTGRTR